MGVHAMGHYSPEDMAAALGRHLLAFPITPFSESLELDVDTYRDHLSWMVEHGPAGIFAAGGTGEFFSLSVDEVASVVRVSSQEVNGRMPVLSGVGYGREIALTMARNAEKAGADGI